MLEAEFSQVFSNSVSEFSQGGSVSRTGVVGERFAAGGGVTKPEINQIVLDAVFVETCAEPVASKVPRRVGREPDR